MARSSTSDKRVALITGGTRGIGSGIAEMFAKEGFDLVLGFRDNFTAAENFKESISNKYGVEIELVSGSIKEDATIERYFETVDNKFEGTLNVLVHNASQIFVPDGDKRHPYEIGAPRDTNFGNLLKTEGKETVDLTLLNHYTDLYSKCLVNLCERALKRMKDDVSSILFISSPGCNITQTVSQGYDMPGFGKSAGEFAIRYYAKNLQPRGINANTIIPGAVNTDAWNGYLKKLGPKLGLKTKEELLEATCKRIGQKRILDPVDIGRVATFLSIQGRCITGMSINADGGIHLGSTN